MNEIENSLEWRYAPDWWRELPRSSCSHYIRHGLRVGRAAMIGGYYYQEWICKFCGARWRTVENLRAERTA